MIMKTSHNHKSPPRSQTQTMPSSSSSTSSSSSSACSQNNLPAESSQAHSQSYIPTKLYVTNFPFSCTQRQIQDLFAQYGQVVECTLKKDYYAYILFTNVKSSLSAYKNANGLKVFGRKLTVHLATSKKSQSHLQNTHQLLNSLNFIITDIDNDESTDLPFDIPKIIHVRNFPETCTVQQIRDIFVQYGDIVECLILHDSYAFVHFKSPVDARLALQSTNNQPFLNSNTNLLVQYSRSKFKSHTPTTNSNNSNTMSSNATTNNTAGGYRTDQEPLDECEYNYDYNDDLDEEAYRQDENAATISRESSACRTKLYVTNFPEDMDQEEMKQLFNQYGQVLECTIMWNQYAFVHFGSYAEAEKALNALKGTQYKGYKISVQWSTSSKYQQPKQHQSKQENTIKILERPSKSDSNNHHSQTWASLVNKTSPSSSSSSSSSSSNKQTNVNSSSNSQTFKISFSEIVRSNNSTSHNGQHSKCQKNVESSLMDSIEPTAAQTVVKIAPIINTKTNDESNIEEEEDDEEKHQTAKLSSHSNDKNIAPIGTQQSQQPQQLHQQHHHHQQQQQQQIQTNPQQSQQLAKLSMTNIAQRQSTIASNSNFVQKRTMPNNAQLNIPLPGQQQQQQQVQSTVIQIPQLQSHFQANNIQFAQPFDTTVNPTNNLNHSIVHTHNPNPNHHHHHHHHHPSQIQQQTAHHHYDYSHNFYTQQPPIEMFQYCNTGSHHPGYNAANQPPTHPQAQFSQIYPSYPAAATTTTTAPVSSAQPQPNQFSAIPALISNGSTGPILTHPTHNLNPYYSHQYQPLFPAPPPPTATTQHVWNEASNPQSSVSLDAFGLNDRHAQYSSINHLSQQYPENKECLMAPTNGTQFNFNEYSNGLLMKQPTQISSQGLLSNALANLTISSSVTASASSRSSSSSSSSSSNNFVTGNTNASTASNSGSSSSTPTANQNKQLTPNKTVESNGFSSLFNSYVLFPSDSFDLTNEKLGTEENDEKSSHQLNGLNQQPFYQIEDVLANLIR